MRRGSAGVVRNRYAPFRSLHTPTNPFCAGLGLLDPDLQSDNLECRRSRSRSRSRGRDDRGGDGGGKRLKGEAARWNPRGFGFIKPIDGGEDLFCHVSCITDGNVLREGDTVEYEVTTSPPA